MLELPDAWVWDFWIAVDADRPPSGAPAYHLFFRYASRALHDPDRRHRQVADAASPLGPFDIAGATLLTDDRFYVGKLIQDPSGGWVLLAFRNRDGDGRFVGSIADPMPIRSTDRGLELVEPSLRPGGLVTPGAPSIRGSPANRAV